MTADVGREATIAVIGGGLAGLAAAAALAERGCRVDLYEARRRPGGRAASYRDPANDESIDHCQHVGMGCCTNWLDFCRRTGLAKLLRRDRRLHFFGPDGRRYDLAATPLLPAPVHLLPSLLRLGYLSFGERIGICRAMLRLARHRADDDRATVGDWLRRQRQSPRALERYWAPVLVSALGESLDRASLKYARQVFVEGFLANHEAYELVVPSVSLSELYGKPLEAWLREHGATLHTGRPAAAIRFGDDGRCVLELADGATVRPDAVVVAVPWRRAAELLAEEVRRRFPGCERWTEIESAPISGVHLWFDGKLTDLPHAVLVGTLAQWIFSRTQYSVPGTEYYYQVVVSASYDLIGGDKEAIVEQIVSELQAAFPDARRATLLRWKIVTEPEAVFSVRPGIDALRPSQETPIRGLFLAGDWTATDWPATMEGAVRSGYLAAEAVLRSLGRRERIVIDDLPRSMAARLVCGSVK